MTNKKSKTIAVGVPLEYIHTDRSEVRAILASEYAADPSIDMHIDPEQINITRVLRVSMELADALKITAREHDMSVTVYAYCLLLRSLWLM